jgi:hypothetical protein
MSRAMSSPGAILIFVAVALGVPAPAAAQIDPGINYDPGSPAGKEYAIPLVEGRSEGAGTTNQRAGGNIPFGVGIGPPGSGGGSGDGDGATGGPNARSGQPSGPGGSEARGGPASTRGGAETPADLNSRIAEAESVGGTAGRTLWIALAVLLAAAMLAVALRGRRPTPSGRAA